MLKIEDYAFSFGLRFSRQSMLKFMLAYCINAYRYGGSTCPLTIFCARVQNGETPRLPHNHPLLIFFRPSSLRFNQLLLIQPTTNAK